MWLPAPGVAGVAGIVAAEVILYCGMWTNWILQQSGTNYLKKQLMTIKDTLK